MHMYPVTIAPLLMGAQDRRGASGHRLPQAPQLSFVVTSVSHPLAALPSQLAAA